jgi:hypothetical protein
MRRLAVYGRRNEGARASSGGNGKWHIEVGFRAVDCVGAGVIENTGAIAFNHGVPGYDVADAI